MSENQLYINNRKTKQKNRCCLFYWNRIDFSFVSGTRPATIYAPPPHSSSPGYNQQTQDDEKTAKLRYVLALARQIRYVMNVARVCHSLSRISFPAGETYGTTAGKKSGFIRLDVVEYDECKKKKMK